tara:strand:+ start:54136 stop:54687 length:552 start_codon:yes stop_codon:yes gene_type:complete
MVSSLLLFLAGGQLFAQRVVVRRPGVAVVRTAPVAPYRGVAYVGAVGTLPRAAVAVSFAGTRYYYGAGLYYRYYGGSYVLVSAPIGIRVGVLPVGYVTVWVNGVPYYYCQGTYYQKLDDKEAYEAVPPPTEALLYTLPEGAKMVEVSGTTYYEFGGSLYKVVLVPDGKAFKVVGNLEQQKQQL